MKTKITFKIINALLVCLAVSLALASCKKQSDAAETPAKNEPLALTAESETAAFLAGAPLPEGSELAEYAKSAAYKRYAADLETGWNKFQKPNLDKMRKWWETHATDRIENSIMYPFSGPDIMNVLAFFPNGDTYTMFGLETPGAVPNLKSMSQQQIEKGLSAIRQSLNSILHVNFFRTESMARDVGKSPLNGITSLVMIFLVKEGCTVYDVRKIAIDAESNISPWIESDDKIDWQRPPKSRRIPGVEITFRRGEGKLQTVRYFMLNVIDQALSEHSPNFIPYLMKQAPCSTFIKSASYLMHNDKIKFTQIRKAILDASTSIVEDDSGVPLRYLKTDEWNTTFHGVYTQPIGLFANRAQKDLRQAFKDKSTGVLPFSYGYDYQAGQSNLIIAEKIKKDGK